MAVYAILVAPTVAQADGSGGTSLARLSYTHCVLIEDPRSRSYCLDYINGVSSDEKWTTAVLWAKYRPGSCACESSTCRERLRLAAIGVSKPRR